MYKYNPIEDCYATKKKILIFRENINLFRKQKKKLNILDYGCGNANDCGKYLFNDVDKYYGYDIHTPSLDYARKYYKQKNIKFNNTIPNFKFDIIIISEVLEHLDQPNETLSYLKSKLRNDGIILGSVPNGFGLTEIEKFIIHKFYIYKIAKFIYRIFKRKTKNISKIPFNYDSGHIQFFTLASFKKIIKNCNLQIEFIRNGTLLGADLSGSTLLKPEIMKKINTKIADFIPSFMSATWIFKLRNE